MLYIRNTVKPCIWENRVSRHKLGAILDGNSGFLVTGNKTG